jgi:integrase
LASIRKRTWAGGKKSAWQVDYTYTDQKGVRRRAHKQFQLKKQAEQWLAQTQVDVSNNTHTPDRSSTTLAEAADRWLRKKENDGCAKSTMAGCHSRVNLYIRQRDIGKVKLSRLTDDTIEIWYENIFKEVSHSCAHDMFMELREILKFAVKRKLVGRNVAKEIDFRPPPEQKKQIGIDIPSKEDLRLILENAPSGWPRQLFTVAALTGMRSGELRALRWEDVDFDNRAITVCRSADRWHNTKLPKSAAGQRQIPMAPLVYNTLRSLAFPHITANVVELTPTKPKGLVFLASHKPPQMLSDGVISKFFSRLQTSIGMLNPDIDVMSGRGRRRDLARANYAEKIMPIIHEIQASGITNPNAIAKELTRRRVAAPRASKWHYQTVKDLLIRNDCGLRRYRFHSLRHFAASWFIEQGFSPKRVQTMIGHSTIQMTFDVYGHLFPSLENDQEKLAKGEAALFNTRV